MKAKRLSTATVFALVSGFLILATVAGINSSEPTIKEGVKFEDLDGDHNRDGGEPGLSGWTIHAYADNNTQNGVLDPDEFTAGPAPNGTAVTGANGFYSMDNLAPGRYIFCEVLQATWTQSFPAANGKCAAGAGLGPDGYYHEMTPGKVCPCNDFGNFVPPIKTGQKFRDVDGDGKFEPGDGDEYLENWPIHIFRADGASFICNGVGPVFDCLDMTDSNGVYSFQVPPGTYFVCEEKPPPTSGQSFPFTQVDECADAGYAGLGYAIMLTSGEVDDGNDFGNKPTASPETPSPSPTPTSTPKAPLCFEDPDRSALITRTVRDTADEIPDAQAPDYPTVQAAYNAAQLSANSNEVIGFFQPTTENIVLNQPKGLTITECRNAQVTALLDNLPVWYIGPLAGHLFILGPSAHEGTIGWHVDVGADGHKLQGLRADGASQYGMLIEGDSNEIRGTNSLNSNGVGIRIEGDNNIFDDNTTIELNTTDGAQIAGTGNEFKAGHVQSNGANGILVEGDNNSVDGTGDIDLNTLHGISVTGNGNTIANNTAHNNTLNGIFVTGDNNTLDNNKANQNDANGIKASSADGASGNTLTDNEANENVLQGIRACGQTNGGGNTGADNGVDPQVDFVCASGPAVFYVADDDDNRVYKYNATGAIVGGFALLAANTDPSGVHVIGSDLYVLDRADRRVYRYDEASGAHEATSKELDQVGGSNLSQPKGLAIDGDHLWVVDDGTQELYRYSLAAAFPAPSQVNSNLLADIALHANNGDPEGLAIDSNCLYVLDDADDNFYRYSRPEGGGCTAAVGRPLKSTSGGNLGTPRGATFIAAGANAGLWIVDPATDKAYKYVGDPFSGSGPFNATSQFDLYVNNDDASGM